MSNKILEKFYPIINFWTNYMSFVGFILILFMTYILSLISPENSFLHNEISILGLKMSQAGWTWILLLITGIGADYQLKEIYKNINLKLHKQGVEETNG